MNKTLLLSITVLASACASSSGRYDPAKSLADADQAFAQDAQARSLNDAFASLLAFDAVMFNPAPVNGLKALKAEPIPAGMVARWAATWAETSADQQIGYTTGPLMVGQSGAANQSGNYITVWHKEGGTWRVMVDAYTPGPSPVSLEAAPAALKTKTGLNRFRNDEDFLLLIDDSLNANHEARLRIHGAPELTEYRAGNAPAAGLNAAIALADANPITGWTRTKVHLARSGDLAYAYGTHNTNGKEGGWLRIYRKSNMARWLLLHEMVT